MLTCAQAFMRPGGEGRGRGEMRSANNPDNPASNPYSPHDPNYT
jgi:hypothetical protein